MSAAGAESVLKNKISIKAFIQGIVAVFVLWMLIAVWLFLSADKTKEKQQAKLASQTVIVNWDSNNKQDNDHKSDGDSAHAESANEQEQITAEPKIEYAPLSVMESGLIKAPIEGLFEETPFGRRPKIRHDDGLTPYKAYKRPFDVYGTKNPIIAVAITGLGLSDVATESALRSMPPEISFILSPYTNAPDFWVTESRQRGHEIWFTLPLEGDSYPDHDPGPHTMLINAPERENTTKLEWLLTRAQGYVGFVTSYRPAFMGSANDMRPVLGGIYNRGLAFVDGSSDPGMIPQTMAAGMKAPYSSVDIWLDRPDASQESIAANLKLLEQSAQKNGYAVGIIHPLPVSYQQVLKWVQELPNKGLTLVPLSATTGY